ncbi:ABC transporter permease [Actinobaculum sp. 352]|uniref:FtsX-like permease family protein n=1 Tax=Actinobaculum sp. 352 TaxID=2490946 RepID=UPI000F7E8E5B|nr:ABC transporter permease [Actinobaculum sp. 352]RTE49587.1 ABC transporter permease [Actinobaculum sp. 352]
MKARIQLTRLLVAGDVASRRRVSGMCVGVMIGVAILLLLLGASRGIGERTERSTWTLTPYRVPERLTEADLPLEPDTAAALTTSDFYGGRTITVVRIAASDQTTVALPGIDRTPRPGEYFASPALEELIGAAPADQLGDRYGVAAGTIQRSGLEGPDALVVVEGVTVDELLDAGQLGNAASLVSSFVGTRYSSEVYQIIAALGAIAMLVPVLLLIAIVTDLGAAQRAEHIATLRLIGATRPTVAAISALEAAFTAFVGSCFGAVAARLLLPAAARVRVNSGRFYIEDLRLPAALVIGIILATASAATLIAWLRARSGQALIVGSIRDVQERRPRVVSIVPLLGGVILLLMIRAGLWGTRSTGLALVAGLLLVACGLMTAGAMLTAWCARLGQRHARRPETLVACARIARHPRAAFRTVSGMVIAVFLVSVFAVAMTAAVGRPAAVSDDLHLSTATIIVQAGSGENAERVTAGIEQQQEELMGVPGVTGAGVGYAPRATDGTISRVIFSAADTRSIGLTVPDGAAGVSLNTDALAAAGESLDLRPTAAPSGGENAAVLLVATDGSAAARERVRTALWNGGHVNPLSTPLTRDEDGNVAAEATENQFAAMAAIGIVIATAISALSLAVATISGILDRRRVFGLLRLTGMRGATLRRIITAETVLPVVVAFLGAVALGVFTGWVTITGLSERSISWPGLWYYGILALCLALVGVAALVAYRVAVRWTDHSATRFE